MKQQRKDYVYEGRTIYQWDESLDSIFCFIQLPPFPSHVKPSNALEIKITSKSVSVGLKATKPYLSHELLGIADTDESVWYLQDKKDQSGKTIDKKQIVIELQKAKKGQRWGAVFKGHQSMNLVEQQELKKKMMLERFQEQNPGFDFSNAQFNGQIPQARTFMGGVKYE